MSEKGECGQPQVMTLARCGGKFESARRGKDENGAIEEGLILRWRAGIGNIEDRLDDD